MGYIRKALMALCQISCICWVFAGVTKERTRGPVPHSRTWGPIKRQAETFADETSRLIMFTGVHICGLHL